MPQSFIKKITLNKKQEISKPMRSHVLSKELLSIHAFDTAKKTQISSKSISAINLKKKFKENCSILNEVYYSLSELASKKEYIAAGGEWLLDNYHIIDEQVREIRMDLPNSYYKALPRIKSGLWNGYPRAYKITCDYIEHSDSLVNIDTLSEYLSGYQKEQILNINELWAIPIMLRLSLIENLKRLSESVLELSNNRKFAEEIFRKISYQKDLSSTEILAQILKIVPSYDDRMHSLYPILIFRLRSLGSSSALGINWLEDKAKERNIDITAESKIQQQIQASDQISIGNCITSLKNIGRFDWRKWFESQSYVTKILASESSNIFKLSDFQTRDLIRHSVEHLSKKHSLKEIEVASISVELANKNTNISDKSISVESHCGYYLTDKGLPILENRINNKYSLINLLKLHFEKNLFPYYLESILLITVLLSILSVFLINNSYYNLSSVLIFTLFLIPSSQFALEFTQWLSSKIIKPKPLAKLDYEEGIPESAQTAVVIQTIVSNKEHLHKTISDLEIRAIGNKDSNIHFGILADLPDAEFEILNIDSDIISTGCQGIRELNEKFSKENINFFILFRKRLWNDSEQKYIGWERKRGKLIEFNKLLRGNKNTSFSFHEGDIEKLLNTTFVITLDNDTHLPPGTAKKLIGSASHPLNTPIIDEDKKIIKSGYGIIQPRVGITLESATASSFASLHSGQSGLDPYTKTISDIYQDLFKEASFIGKGIYHVDTFIEVLQERFPENAILSHDLIESGYARCGLASDIEVFDDFPKHYLSYSKRQHRWIRGDWQLLKWLLSSTPTQTGEEKNQLSSLVKWKLVDNLRRSLNPIFHISIIILCALGLINTNAFFIILVLSAFRVYSATYSLIFSIPIGYSISAHFHNSLREIKNSLSVCFFELSSLPHQAYISLDAILRTNYRVFISSKKLLEWETALHSEMRLKNSLETFIRKMNVQYFIILLLLGSSYLLSSISLLTITLALIWAISPLMTWFLSRNKTETFDKLSSTDAKYLHEIAFDTWRYFRNNFNEEFNYLIPDNIQLNPQAVIAERTSPTNISLSLIALNSAYDLGFIPSNVLLNTSKNIIESVNKLERFEGHLLNWYNLRDLKPLYPRYVSSVDSGNFVGHLIVLNETIKSLPYSPILDSQHIKKLSEIIPSKIESLEKKPAQIIELILNKLTSTENKILTNKNIEVLIDFSSLLPMTNWITKLDIIEELALSDLIPKKLHRIKEILNNRPLTPLLIKKIVSRIIRGKNKIYSVSLSEEQLKSLNNLFSCIEDTNSFLDSYFSNIAFLIDSINKLVNETNFKFLYDDEKKLLSIGYNVEQGLLDSGSYDLLASEARLGSFVGIAKGDLPHIHWFFLGRALTESSGGKALISWSGTMFEYLMPLIVMKDYPSTLLGRTYRSIIKTQQSYAFRRGVPWGISESAYGTVDYEKTYQYRAFGVPGLGLKRGLIEDLVISPYSSALALQIEPNEACKNLHALETIGARGEYGFYEAIDYTQERLTSDESFHIVKSFFAHHQGMTIASINNVLNGNILQERFHKDLRIQSCALLLQERFPNRIPLILPHKAELLLIDSIENESRHNTLEQLSSPHQPFPRTHLLSNSEYNVCIDHRGAGFSSFKNDYMVNRYSPYQRYASQGQFIYVKDLNSDNIWSSTYYPSKIEPQEYRAIFTPDKAEFHRQDNSIHTATEVVVSPEDNLEIRKINLSNLSAASKILEVFSFIEISLAPGKADSAHPAFSKLFLETDWLNDPEMLICKRRPRAGEKESPLLFHFISTDIVWKPIEFTTDRLSFIGRGNDLSSPRAIYSNLPLDKKIGFVLDPCFSLKHLIELNPRESVTTYFITGFADNIEEAVYICKKYKDTQSIRRATELAWSHANVEQKNQQFFKASTLDFQHLGNALLYPIEELRDNSIKIPPKESQKGLWKMGVSGDLPVVLFYIEDTSLISHFQEVLYAHAFLRSRGVSFDLIVLNDKSEGYIQELGDELESSVRASLSGHLLNQSGGIFIKNKNHLSEDDIKLLRACASLILDATKGDLASQLDFSSKKHKVDSLNDYKNNSISKNSNALKNSQFKPVIGEFLDNGRAYSLNVNKNSLPPLPWSNIIANEHIGCLQTETGAGYTWIGNSRENRISTWSNDPITDPHSEVIYIRDSETSSYWCPTPLPVLSTEDTEVKHEPGLSTFTKTENGITSTLESFVSVSEPNRYWLLTLKNNEQKNRTLEIILYIDWVLGFSRSETLPHLFSGVSKEGNFLFVQNHWNDEFKNSTVFIGSTLDLQDFTCEQRNFLGYNSSLSMPHFLEQIKNEFSNKLIKTKTLSGTSLSRKTGFGFDSAGVIKYEIEIPNNSSIEIGFYLSSSESLETAKKSSLSLRNVSRIQDEKAKVIEFWKEKLSVINVCTPDKSFNTIVNSWLPYQTLACRMYARTGFYQSSGAFGFRDQLQDSLSFLYTHPEISRKQIIINCHRQFLEGDVQHWWHPPSGRGIRSKISDNYIWLPYSLLEYLDTTGDESILFEKAPYLSGPEVPEDHHDIYFTPEITNVSENVFQHCIRALERSFPTGPHGLPLIGTGDWNDGMNKVGEKGIGESIWLGWFLASVLERFSCLLDKQGDSSRANKYREHSKNLVTSIEEHAWDGKWYRRAYFDDGTPLGSSERVECRIDSLAQSWGALTNLSNLDRRKEALIYAYDNLYDKENKLVRLLWPPFQNSNPSPGYIQSYPPGIRENGGQYTHGSSWLVAALAKEGFNDKAYELFSAMNPINHTDTLEKALKYKTEPYVTCGDVYSHELHAGRGGWSWYTGSSGWLYQVAIKYILGVEITKDGLKLAPKIPNEWKTYSIILNIRNKKISLEVNSGKDKYKLILNNKVYNNEIISWEDFNEEDNKITLEI